MHDLQDGVILAGIAPASPLDGLYRLTDMGKPGRARSRESEGSPFHEKTVKVVPWTCERADAIRRFHRAQAGWKKPHPRTP
jgi:hypothetical protein